MQIFSLFQSIIIFLLIEFNYSSILIQGNIFMHLSMVCWGGGLGNPQEFDLMKHKWVGNLTS